MHIWYIAVCDQHKEMIDVLVNNPKRTYLYLGDDGRSQRINTWLEEHYNCELRMIHRDDQTDKCYDANYRYINVVHGG